jgi:hypothetical protein
MSRGAHIEKIVEHVHRRVPEARLEATEERLPRWKLANRRAWLEYDPAGKLLISGTKGGTTVTRRHRHNQSASDAAATIEELLIEPVESVEGG